MMMTIQQKSSKAEVTLFTRLKMIAKYLSQPEQSEESLVRSVKSVLAETGEYRRYATIIHKGHVLLDAAKMSNLCKRLLHTLNSPREMDELKYLCSQPQGRIRTRLTGGGRNSLIPYQMAQLILARLTYLTWIHGRFTNEHLKDAIKDYAPHFNVQAHEPGEDIIAIEGHRQVKLTASRLCLLRKRLKLEKLSKDPKTSVNIIDAVNKFFEPLARTRTAMLFGVNKIGNADQSMVFRERPARAYAVEGCGQATGAKKTSGGRSTLSVCAEVSDGRFNSLYVVLESSSVHGHMTAKMTEELASLGLRPGRNDFNTATGKFCAYISSSSNGWMYKYHTPSLVLLWKEPSWKVVTTDNWFGFDRGMANMMLEHRQLSIHTPPGLSLLGNDLDVDFHGTMKSHQGIDTDKCKADPALVKLFRTASGNLKAIPQCRLIRNLIDRFISHYCTPSFRDGMMRISHKTGFGLPVDGSADNAFFSHAFGHRIGERTGLVKAMPAGVDVFSKEASEIAIMKLKRGRKRNATPLANSSKNLKKHIVQIKRMAQDEKDSEDAADRVRKHVLRRVRIASERFYELLKTKYGSGTIDDLDIVEQKTLGSDIMWNDKLWEFDIDRGDNDAYASRPRNVYDFAKVATAEHLARYAAVDETTLQELQEVIDLEIDTLQTIEEDVQGKLAIDKTTVPELRQLLRDAGLRSTGNKLELLARAREHGVVLSVATEEDVDVSIERRKKAETSWRRLRVGQLRVRLNALGGDSKGNKDTLVKRMAQAVKLHR